LALVAFVAGRALRPSAARPETLSRLTVNLPDETELASLGRPVAVLSPNGDTLALTAYKGERNQIWLRRLDSFEATPVGGTEDANEPFFSPDGKWIGFHAHATLKKIQIGGGGALDVAHSDGMGATWLPDDTIVFNREYQDGLYRVSAGGGQETQLTSPDRSRRELGHFWPQALPDGKHILFTNYSSPIEQSRIEVLALDSGQRKVIVEGGLDGKYVGSGLLVYARKDSIVAVRFDPATLTVAGQPVALNEDIVVDPSNGVAHLSVSANGTMAYISAASAERPRSLVWVDRAGNTREITPTRRRYSHPRLSPDGTRVAVTITEKGRDVWIEDIGRNVPSRITSGPAAEFDAVWAHSGNQLLFANETPAYQVFSTLLSPGATPRAVVATEYDTTPTALTPDDAMVIYDVSDPKNGQDIMIARVDGKGSPKAILHSRFDEGDGALSPDGRWLAYTSNESGRSEVYVQAFPTAGERYRVSTDSGFDPRWSQDGKELFFVGGPRMYAVPIKTSPTFAVGTPTVLFTQRQDQALVYSGFDVAKDGRFVMVQHDAAEARTPINVVTNWIEELKQKVR
jgi:Tol biopolymer transport system component